MRDPHLQDWRCDEKFSDLYRKTGVKKWLPETCPQFSAFDGVRCLLSKDIDTLNFVGDSINGQIRRVMMCGLEPFADPFIEQEQGRLYLRRKYIYRLRDGEGRIFFFYDDMDKAKFRESTKVCPSLC